MKKIIFVLFMIFIAVLLGITRNKEEAYVVNTFEKIADVLTEEYIDESKEVIKTIYYEMSDRTWKTDDYTYKYKLVLTGKLNHAVSDITYVILSNTDDITFDQAWKASGFSSYTDDYFAIEDAIIVAIS